MAGLGPEGIEFAELHDCFTIAEIVALEDLGFVAKGEGGPYSAAGGTARTGEKPINTSGGLKSKGHPVGATGVAQLCDLVLQIRGEAGERQMPAIRLGAAQKPGRVRRDLRGDDSGGAMTGVVYTETVVHSAPEAFAAEAPYQVLIVTLDEGGRIHRPCSWRTRVAIGDRVVLEETRNGIPFFKKTA